MTDELLRVETHRQPDGSRPLIIGRPKASVTVEQHLHSAAQPLTCFVSRWASRFRTEPPAACRRVIAPGEYYLSWAGDVFAGRSSTGEYCAPCAINEWSHLAVREATDG